jgi:serine phosphatase RsbU (regulator of sigma subunit)/PAS domain-containing protein
VRPIAPAIAVTLAAAAFVQERHRRLATERSRERADLLARAGELFETSADPLARLDELAALAAPGLADLAVVDLIGADGALRAAGAAGEGAEDVRASRIADPVDPAGPHPVAVVARSGEPLLLRDVKERDSEEWATSRGHFEVIRRLGYGSAAIVPLSARGRTIGTMALVRFRHRRQFDPADLSTAADVARRAGVAIDHSRLSAELGETTAELRTVLGALAEAVTVQRADGALVYANQSAAELNGFASVEDFMATPLTAHLERWEVHDEHGAEVGFDRLPGRRALAGDPDPEPLLLQVMDRRTGERRWRLVKARPILDGTGRPRLAVNVFEDVTEQREHELAQAFLARASKLLGASLDPAETLDNLAKAVVPELADWCAVDMPDERGVLRRVATADRRPERTREAALIVRERSGEPALPVGPPQVMRSGRPEYYPQITDELLRAAALTPEQLELLRGVGARSAIIVPMVATTGVIGTITIGTIESARALTPRDLDLAAELGRRAGIAVEHSRIHGERSEIAATLQAALLPPRLPVVPGVAIAARFRAVGGGDTVGGDFYDLFPTSGTPQGWMVVMGDVTGKGPAAAAVTSLVRYATRTAAMYERDPSEVLHRLNDVLTGDDQDRRPCTAVCVRVDTEDGRVRITVACAGHPPPLLTRPDGDVVPFGRPGTLLGAFEEGHWTSVSGDLQPGESLVLFTDGVTDTRGPEGRFGIDRLERVLAGAAGRTPEEVTAALDAALQAFQKGRQRDDVAVLVLQASPVVSSASIAGAQDSAEDAGSSPAAA